MSRSVLDPKKPWFEPACAVLMAISSVATAWCSYQSSAWSGQSSDLAARAAKLQRHSNAQHLEALQIEAIQMREFMEAIDAQMQGNEKLARFYTDRFADELKPAYAQWIALHPFENPAAPPHPFVASFYTPRFEEEIRRDQAEGERAEQAAGSAGKVASSYLSNTVSLATVLLFAATAEKFEQRRVRWGALGFAVAVFFYSAIRTATLPIN
jgi:hypothetical protein